MGEELFIGILKPGGGFMILKKIKRGGGQGLLAPLHCMTYFEGGKVILQCST